MERFWYRIFYLCAFIGMIYSEQSVTPHATLRGGGYTVPHSEQHYDSRYIATRLMPEKRYTPEELKTCRDKQSTLAFLRKIVRFETSPSQISLWTKKIRELENEVDTLECPPVSWEPE